MYSTTYSLINNKRDTLTTDIMLQQQQQQQLSSSPNTHVIYNSIGMPMGIVSADSNSIYQQTQLQNLSFQIEQNNTMLNHGIIQSNSMQQQMDQQLQALQQQSQMQLEQLNAMSSNIDVVTGGLGTTSMGMSSLGGLNTFGALSSSPYSGLGGMGIGMGMMGLEGSAGISSLLQQQQQHKLQQEQLRKQKEKENIDIARQQMKLLQQGIELTPENCQKYIHQPSNNTTTTINISLVDDKQPQTNVKEGILVDLNGPFETAQTSNNIDQELSMTKKQLEEERESSLCPICMDRRKDMAIDCGHVFCGDCLQWIGGRHLCPICRQEFKNKIRLHMNS